MEQLGARGSRSITWDNRGKPGTTHESVCYSRATGNSPEHLEQRRTIWECLGEPGIIGHCRRARNNRDNSEQRGILSTARVNRSRQEQYGNVKEGLGMFGMCRYPRTARANPEQAGSMWEKVE